MKNRTLRRAAETLVLLLIAAMALLLGAGRGVRCPQHRLVPADGRRAARSHAPGHASG